MKEYRHDMTKKSKNTNLLSRLEYAVFGLSLLTILTLPFSAWAPLFGITLSRFTALIFLTVWGIYVLVASKRLKIHPFLFTSYILLIYVILNASWSINMAESMSSTVRLFSIILFITAIWHIYDSPRKSQLALQILIIGGYIALLGIFINFIHDITFSSSTIRYNIPGYRPNRSGGIIATLLPVALLLIRQSSWNNKFLNWLNIAYVPLGTLGVLLSGSRVAFVALLPVFLLILYDIYGYTSTLINIKSMIIIICSIFSFGLILNVFSTERIDYLSTIPTEIASGDLGGRGEIWQASFSVFPDAAIGGFGSGAHRYAVEPILSQEYSAHNTQIAMLVEWGILGSILFLCLILYLIRALVKSEYTIEWATIFSVWFILSLAFTWHLSSIWWVLSIILVKSSI